VRVLVTGAGGQVGAEVVGLLEAQPHHEVVGLDHAGLDCGDRDAVEQVVGAVLPDAVVHCAAWTNVDGCESDPDRAWRDNGLAVRHVAVAASRVGAHVTHVSTDYVFDGELDRPYVEWDAVGPRSAYGRSKLAGEIELQQHATSWTLVRTAWVFGRRGGNFVDTMLRVAGAGGPLRVVDDQRGSPTYAPDLAEALVRLTVGRLAGTFHVTNQGSCTWHRFAEEIVAAAGLAERAGPVAAISSAELGRPAPRPSNSELANTALRLSGLPLLRDYHEALHDKLTAVGATAAPRGEA
jgi:dTDP-4-dehydrorhamnose reductase